MSGGMTQAEFARANEWAPSYVTKLKGQGRLVLLDDGKIDPVATLERIKATSAQVEKAAPKVQGEAFRDSADRDKWYAAELKRLEYEKAIGQVLDAAQVADVVADAVTRLRTAIEAWPDTLAPELAAMGSDESRMRALMTQHLEHALAELSRSFAGLAQGARGGPAS